MDAKFRKLISRLSIKDRMRPEKNMSGGESQINHHQDAVIDAKNILAPSVETGCEKDASRQILIPHPINYWPESNILTQLQFPCPTLARKNKCSSILMEEESFYEELKPRDAICSANFSNESDALSYADDDEEKSEGEEDKSITILEVGSNPEVYEDAAADPHNNGSVEGIYINLQELEQERRRLIAAQCVRAKYAENWIGDSVEEISIAGNNREKTKIYWETQMRNEQKERNKGKPGYWNNNAPSSELIIQKMNAEIEELHRREKELKKKKTEADEEDEAFSSNTSSVDEFENSESPRLESGFYSNAGEDESIPSPELLTEALEITVNETRSLTQSPTEPEVFSPEVQRSEAQVSANFSFLDESETSPILKDQESPPPKYIFQKETPIEREIRLARERDNELRMMRRLSSSTSNLSEFASLPASPAAEVKPKPAGRVVVNSTAAAAAPAVIPDPVKEEKVVAVEKTAHVNNKASYDSRDIQYRMATDRLKKEIQEAKQREEELKSRELVLKPVVSSPTTPKSYVPSYVAPVKAFATKFEEGPSSPLEKTKPKLSVSVTTEEQTKPNLPERKDSLKTTEQRKDSLKSEASPVSPVVETTTTTSTTTQNEAKPASDIMYNTLTRPKFNSIERYLLKSSLKLRIGKNFQIPTAAAVFETPEPVIPEKTEEEEEPVTPRKRLVRAQDKINQELKEMREREKEFALRRAFKSTPDLTKEAHLEEEVKVKESEPEVVVVVRPQSEEKETVSEKKERRRSALINQWEEKIQGAN